MGDRDIKQESLLLQYFCITLLEEETNAIIALMKPKVGISEGGAQEREESDIKSRRMNLTKESIKRRKEELLTELEEWLQRPMDDVISIMQEYLTQYNVAYDEREEIYYVIPKFMDPKAEKYQVQLGTFVSIYEACEYLNGKKRKNLF